MKRRKETRAERKKRLRFEREAREAREARELREAKAREKNKRYWKGVERWSRLFDVLEFLGKPVQWLLTGVVFLVALVLAGVVGAALIVAPLFLWYWGTEKGVIPDNKGLLLIYIGVVYYLIPWTLGQIMKWPAIDERTALAGVLTNRPKIVILRHVPGSSSSSGRHKFQR